MSFPYFQEMGSTVDRTCAASQPVLTGYKLLEIERPTVGLDIIALVASSCGSNPTASFNSLSNVLVLKGVVTARSWLTEGTLQWSWDPCPLPPQVIELSVVKMRSANSFLLQKLFP